MRVELGEVEGYHTYGYFEPVNHHEGYHSLKITTRWETAKDPYAEQTKFTMLLSPGALANLRELIK